MTYEHSPKITVIGGGSIMWTPNLLNDIRLFDSLKEASLVLHDIDKDSVDRIMLYQDIINSDRNSNIRLIKEMDRNKALEGADFVIIQITAGGLEAMRYDIEIPLKYGVRQPVGDTIGPGGISRALRNIPVFVEFGRDMERVCPEAWVLNITNPMTTLCRTLTKTTSLKTLGLCHELFNTLDEFLSPIFGCPWDCIEVKACGVNHFLWVLGLSAGDRDGFELLDEWLTDNWKETHSVKLTLYRDFGALPAPGDRHIVEFLPMFLHEESNFGAGFGVKHTTIEDRYGWFDDYTRKYESWLTGKKPLPAEPSHEQSARIMNSLLTGENPRYVVNIPNRGAIPLLPDDAVVEIMADIDREGVHPVAVENVPRCLMGLFSKIVYEQELIVEAALEGDYHKALRAMLMDPNIPGYDSTRKMLNELMEAHKNWLPQFNYTQRNK